MASCKICKSVDILNLEDQETFSYKGEELSFTIEYSICNSCEREFIEKGQIKRNDQKIQDVKRHFDGLLGSKEIQDIRKSLRITQQQAAQIFGGGKNAFSKYENGKVAQSNAMDKLIRMTAEFPIVFQKLQSLANIIPDADENPDYSSNILPFDHNKKSRKTKKYKVSKYFDDIVEDVKYG